MFEVKKYEFLLCAETPIAHHAEVFGNHAVVARRKIRQPNGTWAQVPIISGDSMRHGLREAAAYAFLDAANMLDKGELTEAALRLLFNGGMVTGRGDASNIKLDQYREMIDLMPALAILGGCASNRVIPGRIQCEDAILVCQESKGLVPAWTLEEAGEVDTCRAHVEVAQRVRMDALLDPGKRKLLSDGANADAQRRLLTSEVAHDMDDAVLREDAKSSMMPRTYETVASGSLFSWRIVATLTSELELDTFHTMVAAFLSNARVGGKRGTGHGLITALKGRNIVVNRPAERTNTLDLAALAPKIGEMFRAHVRERADKIRPFLTQVDA
mgnify:CR=1 FL=1|jgi:hypothetical protein